MSSFTGDLTITQLKNWRIWRLEQDFIYEVGDKGSGKKIVVPKGFVTDGASIPQIFWVFLPTWGSYSRAAVVHDYLCILWNSGTPHVLTPVRKDVDAILYEAMMVSEVNIIIAYFIWLGARVGSLVKALRRKLGYTNVTNF